MTFPDPRLARPGSPPEFPDNTQDVIPPTERSEDALGSEIEHGLTIEGARPLTQEERKAADRDAPTGERVYAPASARVPVEPVAGHRDFIEHPDTHTAEREAAGTTSPSGSQTMPGGSPAMPGASSMTPGVPVFGPGMSSEPSFARVPRPNTTDTPRRGAYASATSNPGWDQSNDALPDGSRRRTMFLSMGFSWFTLVCTGAAVWWFMRRRRERNKPLNRFRLQARQAASQARQAASQARRAASQTRQAAGQLRQRVPVADEAARPAMGLTTAVVSILVLLWQQSQARPKGADATVRRGADQAARRADQFTSRATTAVSEIDWQNRLAKLKERWNPSRVELEKVSISRH